jgi:hypothetical protein
VRDHFDAYRRRSGQARVLYWYPPTQEGFVAGHSKRRFFRGQAADSIRQTEPVNPPGRVAV